MAELFRNCLREVIKEAIYNNKEMDFSEYQIFNIFIFEEILNEERISLRNNYYKKTMKKYYETKNNDSFEMIKNVYKYYDNLIKIYWSFLHTVKLNGYDEVKYEYEELSSIYTAITL